MASTNQDILAGGLFEDGSLFDDAPASMPPSERQPESDFNDGPGDFGGPGERREIVEASSIYILLTHYIRFTWRFVQRRKQGSFTGAVGVDARITNAVTPLPRLQVTFPQ